MRHSAVSSVKTPWIYAAILYACSLFLFLEWLYPIGEVTDTSGADVFILYTLFCFLISILNVYWWLSFIAKGAGLLFVLNRLFFDGSFVQLGWLGDMRQELTDNFVLLYNQDWYHLTPAFRSLLFLILIWLMSYLLYYWFVTMKYVFVFVALTIVYVSLADTFTTYDAGMAIIRVVIISLVAMGLTNLLKEQTRENLYIPRFKKGFSWSVPIIVIVLLTVSFGYAAPKFSPQWADPVSFLDSMTNKPGSIGWDTDGRTVGYGEDDTTLGGSFEQDDTVVFEAEATEKQYWRMETKDVYTGKGWKRSEESSLEPQDPDDMSLETFADDVDTETEKADLTFSGDVSLNKLIYPYGMTAVDTDNRTEFSLDTSNEAIETRLDGNKTSLDSYTIRYDEPSFDVDRLRDVNDSDPESIQEQYTQLPDSLPDRVGDLADEITEDFSSRYDQAKAVEKYFGENDFTYQLSDVPVPEEDEDYVDQFLYDTKAGYCDNYSTSMIVMLRTLDIPARWAKGFTGGEKVDETEDSDGETKGVYEITNANAHSWVEVYFPDIGWVPFEPTQGFNNQADFFTETDEDGDALDPSGDEEEPPEAEENDNDNDDSSDANEETEEESPENESEADEATSHTPAFSYWYLFIIAVVLILLGGLLYLRRSHIRAYLFRRKWAQGDGDVNNYRKAYLFLLHLLAHKGLKKTPEQTLREFAGRMDRRFHGDAMKQLTVYYEQMVYHDNIDDVDTDAFEHIWGQLVERILGK